MSNSPAGVGEGVDVPEISRLDDASENGVLSCWCEFEQHGEAFANEVVSPDRTSPKPTIPA